LIDELETIDSLSPNYSIYSEDDAKQTNNWLSIIY